MKKEDFDNLIKKIEDNGVSGVFDFPSPVFIQSAKEIISNKYLEPIDKINIIYIGSDKIFFSFSDLENSVAYFKIREYEPVPFKKTAENKKTLFQKLIFWK